MKAKTYLKLTMLKSQPGGDGDNNGNGNGDGNDGNQSGEGGTN